MLKIDYNLDGIDHIRLAPDAKTDIGRKLHIGARRPFVDDRYGYFESIAAFWLWYCNGRSNILRKMHYDNHVRDSWTGLEVQDNVIAEVEGIMEISILADSQLCRLMQDSSLPFLQYDVIRHQRSGEVRIHRPSNRQWYERRCELIRNRL